jgi:hypothetical protein
MTVASGPMVRPVTAHWQRAALIALSLLLSALVVLWFRADYFVGYGYSRQNALGSSDFHAFAWGATAYTSLIDVLVTKRLMLDGSIVFHPHYTNGYPLLGRAWFAIFGEGLVASRMLPISVVAIGALMFLSRLAGELRNPLVLMALPLLYLSSIGRDAASFEMLEPAHFLVLGLCALVLYDSPFPRWARAACVVLCVFIYQISAAFMLAVIVAEYLRARDRTTLVVTTATLLACALVVAAAFAHAGGWHETVRILLQRSGIDAKFSGYDESVPFALLFRLIGARLHYNVAPVLFLLSFVEIVLLIRQRRFLLPCVYLGYLVYALVLRNFVGVHPFTFLPFVFFVIAALTSFAWRIAVAAGELPGMAVRVAPSLSRRMQSDGWSRVLVQGGVAVLATAWLAVDIGSRPARNPFDPWVHADFDAITAYVAGHDISKCGTFAVTGLLSDERIVYFLLTRHIKRGAGEACTIALTPQVQPDTPARL